MTTYMHMIKHVKTQVKNTSTNIARDLSVSARKLFALLCCVVFMCLTGDGPIALQHLKLAEKICRQ